MLGQHRQQLIIIFHKLVEPLLQEVNLDKELLNKIILERPQHACHGDVACNIAMQLAKPLKKNPRDLAQQLTDSLCILTNNHHPLIAHAEIAGPGFINLRLTHAAKQAVVTTILAQGKQYGHSARGKGEKVLLEFVSANPTGPLHVGHGRQAALGDTLAALFTSQGYDVQREFYYNDAGVQIATLAASVQARALGHMPGEAGWPEVSYHGDYISDIAADFLAQKIVCAKDGQPIAASGNVNDIDSIRAFAVAYLRQEQDQDLQAFGVSFDHFFLESSLYRNGKVDATIKDLITSGNTYKQNGALWLKTTIYDDDKDRVMKKSDGSYTYFVPDVAYHLDKWARGYHRAINIQGSDHHGTIARVRAGLQAVNRGIPANYPCYLLHKMVTVMRGGAEVKISKRAGSYVTLRDLIGWSSGPNNDLTRGRDAVRFFLISRKADTEFVFDVDLALTQSDENPVYYIQYAHARICSVLSQWGGNPATLFTVNLTPLCATQETALMACLAEYPDTLTHALEEYAPHTLAFYLRELAASFHVYYNAQRILIDDEPLKLARLALLEATRQTLCNGLALLGVSTPSRM